MPLIFGWKEILIFEEDVNEARKRPGFRTEALILRDALDDYGRHHNVSIKPFVPQPGSGFLESERFVYQEDHDGDMSGVFGISICRGDAPDLWFEAGQDFDFVLLPDDEVHISPLAC